MFDLLFPSYCVNCGKVGEYLCSVCKKKLKKSLPECYACRRISNCYTTHNSCNKNNIEAAFIGWQYDSIAKNLLSQLKYRYAYKISDILSKLLIDRLEETQFVKEIDKDSILIPIPSHISHIKKRGFNQIKLIAEKISGYFNLAIYTDFMVRDSDSRYQSKLSSDQRASLGSVFKIRNKIKDKNIILIDDVITTGTTINRAARSLNGNNIKAIALFRGKPHYH